MKKNSRPQFFNRELSWLEFNDRVLSLAFDTAQPLLERVKFLAITASNLDEFLMVRVGGLQAVAQRKMNVPDFSGLTPAQQLSAIDFRLSEFVRRQYECFRKLINEDCKKAGIVRTMADGLSDEQAEHCAYVFEHELFPVLTPIAVSAPAHVPLLSNASGFPRTARHRGSGLPSFTARKTSDAVSVFPETAAFNSCFWKTCSRYL